MTHRAEWTDVGPTRRRSGRWLLFATLCGLLAAAPLWGPGIVATRGGGDSPFLLQRTMDLAEALRDGTFPVRWMAHAAYDLGYPFFSYYAALPYYISGALTALGINVLSAIQTTQTLGFMLAAVSSGLWARRLFRSRAAQALSIIAYTFAPFHMVNVYVRGDSLSEFYAFVWFPLILWSLDRLAARPTWSRALAAACAYSALILTHNVSALIFSPFALAYAVALTLRVPGTPAGGDASYKVRWPVACPRWHRTGYAVAPFALGFLLTAWFWLPAVAETGYGQMGAEFTEGYFHYSQHFRGLSLVQPSPAFDYSVAGTVEAGGPFTMGLIQAVVTLIGCLAVAAIIVRSYREGRAGIGRGLVQQILIMGSLVLATFLITPLSKPLWDHLPLLPLVQFPWRFLSVQALFTAALTGAIVELGFLIRRPLIQWLVAGSIAVLFTLATLVGLKPDRLMIAPEDVTWEALRLYEAFTGNIGTTIRYEYLPESVVPRLYISEAVIDGQGSLIAADGRTLEGALIERSSTTQTWMVRKGEQAAAVAFPVNWWPGWQSFVDGVSVLCYPMVGSGRVTLEVPPGDHTVVLELRPTRLQRLAGLASLATIFSVLAGAALRRGLRLYHQKLLRAVTIVTAMLVSALAGPVLLQRTPKGSATFFDFIQLPYGHRGPIDFGSARLLDAQLSSDTAAPGDELTATLSWLSPPAQPLTVTLRLVSPAVARHGVDIAFAHVSSALESAAPMTLELPADLPRGLYLVELALSGSQGEFLPGTGEGRGMGTLYIGAVRVPKGPPLSADATTLAEFEDLRLLRVEMDQPRATELQLRMHWSTLGTPRNWSLSLRVLDLEGRLIVQQDLQPGYGYLPTTLWRPDERIVDTLIVPLPEGLAPGDYTLRVVTYLEATMHSGGEADIPVHIATPTLWDIRDACCEQTRKGATILCQTDEIALLSLDAAASIQEGEDLNFAAEWNALRAPTEDVQATWTLINTNGDMVTALDAPLAVGSRTSEWPRHSWVLSPQRLDLPQRLDEGPLELYLTLEASDAEATACGRVATIGVLSRPRVFSTPTPAHTQHATFGDDIVLLGYDLERHTTRTSHESSLSLTLWWQASQAPLQDLKRFVHLYVKETEAIVAQDDAMPRGWTYPTTLWVAGEVISETVTLDLSGIPPGTYNVGVGWYDPSNSTRLAVTAADPAAVKSDRLTLDAIVAVER